MKGITSLISILLFNTIYSNYIDTFFSYKLTGRRLSLRELLDEGIKKKDCSNYDAAFNNPPTTTEYDKSYKGDNTTTSDNIGTDVDARYNGLKNIYQSVTPVVGTAAIYPVFALAFKDDDAEGMKVVKAEYDGYITVALDNTNTMKPIAEIL